MAEKELTISTTTNMWIKGWLIYAKAMEAYIGNISKNDKFIRTDKIPVHEKVVSGYF